MRSRRARRPLQVAMAPHAQTPALPDPAAPWRLGTLVPPEPAAGAALTLGPWPAVLSLNEA